MQNLRGGGVTKQGELWAIGKQGMHNGDRGGVAQEGSNTPTNTLG